MKNNHHSAFGSLNKHFQRLLDEPAFGFMPYMLWQKRMTSNFSSLSLVPVLVPPPVLLFGANGA